MTRKLALFVTADIPNAYTIAQTTHDQKINELVKLALERNDSRFGLWLATSETDVDQTDSSKLDEALSTEPPISSDYTSPYIGYDAKSLQGVLQNLPWSKHLEQDYFLILDEQSAQDNSFVIAHPLRSYEVEERKTKGFEWSELELGRCDHDNTMNTVGAYDIGAVSWMETFVDTEGDRAPGEWAWVG